MLSLGFLPNWLKRLLFSKSAPQFIQVWFKPKDIAPQLSHVLIFELKDLKPINAKSKSKRGIRKIRSKIFPGTKSSPGYVKSYEIDVVIPCGGESKAKNIDDNDCSEGSVIGGLLGAGIALSSSRGKDRFWAVPAGGTAGALIGCQVDGG